MKLRVAPVLLAATALATATAVPSLAGATGPAGTGVTGEYVGSIGLNGGFSPNLAAIAAEAGAAAVGDGYLVFLYDLAGPLTITMTDGAMDGSWAMAGTGLIEGDLSSGGMQLLMYGDGVFDGTGTLSGTPGAYRFNATFDSSATVTIENQFTGPITSTESGIDSYSTALTSVSISCDQISGRWDYEINQGLEGINVDAFLNGYFTAVSAPEEIQEVASEITDNINAWADSAANDPGPGLDGSVLEAIIILEVAQDLSADLVAAGGCTPPCDFSTPMNFAAADFAVTSLANNPGSTTSYLVSLLLGSGSLSDCDPELAEQLRQMLVDDLNIRIADLLAEGAETQPNWERDMIDAARAAQMLGMETFGPGGVSPSDVSLILGDY
jgi:hypothetical protein